MKRAIAMLFSRYPLSVSERKERWGILPLVSAPIVGAFFYNQGYRIPFLLCPFKYYTGIPCPFCGMTRSFMAIAREDWHQALAQHLFGPVLFIGLAIASIQIALELSTGRKISAFYMKLLKRRSLKKLVVILLLSYYLIRLYYLFTKGELYADFLNSDLGKMLLFIRGCFESRKGYNLSF